MNVPVSARIDQLRLSLERARWVLEDTAGEVVVVNVAGYEVFAARERRAVLAAARRGGHPGPGDARSSRAP